MRTEDRYFQTLSQAELWQRYCGYLDLSADEFVEVQQELLMAQIERAANSTLGKKIMGDQLPQSMAEFRRSVPLTSYADYEPHLLERDEDALAEKPHSWAHSSGRGGTFHWVPYTKEFVDVISKRCISCFVLCSTKKKGQVNVAPKDRFLLIMPPPPYASGHIYRAFSDQFSMHAMPPLEAAEKVDFQERMALGFNMALRDGVDFTASAASVLVRIGKAFSSRITNLKAILAMLHPKILFRIIPAVIRSKRNHRPMLPRDIWSLKGVVTGGVDNLIYKDEVAYYWGHEPTEVYGSVEAGILFAVAYWNRDGLIFFPDVSFLELIPYEELQKQQENPAYHPSTVLLNEVEVGKLYEVVITQLYGMPLMRYRMNDLIKVVSLGNESTGVNLPHFVFQRRTADIIDLGSMVTLDEKSIWQALAATGIDYTEWAACKEYDGSQAYIRLYVETGEQISPEEIAIRMDAQLKLVDTDYQDVDTYMGYQPVRVTLLSPGTFQRYTDEKVAEGADLAHLKPAHINPPQALIQRLLEFSVVTDEPVGAAK